MPIRIGAMLALMFGPSFLPIDGALSHLFDVSSVSSLLNLGIANEQWDRHAVA
jgi:hypothetical protein